MGLKNICAIIEWSTSVNLTQLREFLVLCGFYSRFISGYSKHTKNFTNLMRKGAFLWTLEAQDSFDKFKELMTSCPVLALADFRKPFEWHCEECGEGVGAVLMQDKHLIYYESRKLRGTERSFNTYDKETLAIIHALAKFRQHLMGRKFNIKIDHNSLKHFLWK